MSVPVTVINAQPRSARAALAELWAYRELLYFLVWRDAKVRYRHTVLGAAWAVLQPAVTMGVFAIVFGRLAHLPSDGQPYTLFAVAALVPWTYFSAAVSSGANALIGNEHLVSKVYFPRLLIPIAAVITPLIDFAISLGLLVAVLAVLGRVPAAAIVMLPLFTVLAIVTAAGAALCLSAVNVAYRDVRHALPFLLQFGIFITPVAYATSLVPAAWRPLYAINPMATVVEGFRAALLGTSGPMPAAVLVSMSAALLLVMGGLRAFSRMEGTFADLL